MMRAVLLFLLLGSLAAVAHAEQFNAMVITVFDGDTVMVARSSGSLVKVRLAGIDAPEKAQPGGVASMESLSGLALHKQVEVNGLATDVYGRLVAHLAVDGKSINEEQVRRGMAWAAVGWRQSRRAAPSPPDGRESGDVPPAGDYSYFHRDRAMQELQKQAQQGRRGLWVEPDPVTPWVWRKQHHVVKINN